MDQHLNIANCSIEGALPVVENRGYLEARKDGSQLELETRSLLYNINFSISMIWSMGFQVRSLKFGASRLCIDALH